MPRTLLTWLFIFSTFIPPALLLTGGGILHSLTALELKLALYGIASAAVVGIVLGFIIRPTSESAGLAVVVSPLVTLAIWVLFIIVWELVVDKARLPEALRVLLLLSLGLLALASPTAGALRAVHWIRDPRS